MMSGLVLLVAACGEPNETGGQAPDVMQVVVDGDFGPDDMMAVLYLVQQPQVNIRAVTVVGTGLAH